MEIENHKKQITALIEDNNAEKVRTPFLDAARGSLSNALLNLGSHTVELERRAKQAADEIERKRNQVAEHDAAAKAAPVVPTAEAKAAKG